MFFSRKLQIEADLWGKSRTGSFSRGGAGSLQSRLGGVGAGPGSLASGPQLRTFHPRRGLWSSAGPLPGQRLPSGRGNGPSVCSVCHNHVGGLRLGGAGAPLQSMLGAGEGALAGGRLGGQAVGRQRSGSLLVALAVLVFRGHFLQGADWPRGAAHDPGGDQSRGRLVQLWAPVLVGEVLQPGHQPITERHNTQNPRSGKR